MRNLVLGAVIGGLAVGHLKGKLTIDVTFTRIVPLDEAASPDTAA